MKPSRPAGVSRIVLGVVVPAAVVVATVLPPLLEWSQLPARMADHWVLGGAPNGSMPKPIVFAISLAFALAGAALAFSWALGPAKVAGASERIRRPRRVVGSGLGLLGSGLLLCGLGAATSLAATSANLDARSWRAASLGATGRIALLAGPVLLTAAGLLAARRGGLRDRGAGAPDRESARLGLADGERALWVGCARSVWAPPVAVVGLGVGIAVGFFEGWGSGLPLLVVGVAFGFMTSVRVTASASGVNVAYGPLRWPVTRIALRQVIHAEAIEVVPTGWGYRGNLRLFGRAAVIIRKGEGLELSLTGGKSFVVTVDDPATAAGLVNDELARCRETDGEA